MGLCLDHHHRLESMASASVGGNRRRILPPLHHDVMRLVQTVCRRCHGGSLGGSYPGNDSSSTRMEQRRLPHPFLQPRLLVHPSGPPSRAPPNSSRSWRPWKRLFHSGLLVVGTTSTFTRIQGCASFSTVATILPEPEQDQPDDDRDDDHSNPFRTCTTDTNTVDARKKTERSRPRLRALRHLLQTEARPPPKNSTSRPPPLVTQSSPPPPPPTLHPTKPTQEVTKSSSPSNPKTVEELRRWIQQLPDISHPSNNTNLDDDQHSMVLTDRFHRRHTYLRLSLTERCNLRCTYCMPEHGVPLQPPHHLLQTPELLHLAGTFAHHGVTKFRLTGGEPTLRRDVVDIVHGLAALYNNNNNNKTTKRHIGMTTNGLVLASQLPALMEAGLTHVNVSLDTLQADKFATLTRRPGSYLTKVWESLEACHDLLSNRPGHGLKLNCVVMRHVNTSEIADFVRLTQTTFPHASIRFIEYMPFTQNGWNTTKLVPYQELLTTLAHDHGIDLTPVPSDDPSDTTKWYTTPWDTTSTTTTKTTAGRIGFITSMTDHFCGSCNRLRLTADGTLKVCLFDGTTEFSLRDALRAGCTEYEVSKVVHAALQQKQWKLGGHASPISVAAHADSNQPMTLIGG